MVRQIPNLFTLLNLIFGCIAIVFILQTGQSIVLLDNNSGATQVVLAEKMTWGALFIFAAAVVDFLDGFLARMLKVSSEMGKQLDSLSDVVSFGVAPGLILYQLLRISFAQDEGGLDVSMLLLIPAFIYSGAVAWRLAKFNIATNQSSSFRGVPSPAAGLLVASFPLIIWYEYFGIQTLFINRWFLYGIIAVLSYLLVSNHVLMAIKFTDFSFRNNLLKYILLAVSLVALVVLKWLAVPVIFVLYLVISGFAKDTVPVHPVKGSV
ncbi:CDP-alcohol phosphatidyltransferase family protein [Paracnuella aquatica]|uniref:CDP-alcohol phosphatidyltransferase family protein n=1 Tax=Paracnuella aquatica TaxID=2268757 RepID=UPI000DEF4069|nr:CDP-alcohol phosphatidyltransferase family protein [Paracnuella aquatica]RPD48883.1 CDP-alcohol phosphatidyltransferase [Paracnuella aquatica]